LLIFQLLDMKISFLSNVLPVLGLTFVLSSVALAQGDVPPSGGVEPTAPTGVPIDGGASLLLAGGVAYGLKKLRDRRRSA
jgi:hypothetical protein